MVAKDLPADVQDQSTHARVRIVSNAASANSRSRFTTCWTSWLSAESGGTPHAEQSGQMTADSLFTPFAILLILLLRA